MTGSFDGHANCFIESGDGKALLIDFNYDTEPLPGSYPCPSSGRSSLLKETRANHLGKLAFRWIYWNVLLPGRPLPLPAHMSMAGKHTADDTDPPEGVTMPVTTLDGHEFHVNEEGFLTEPAEWDEELAAALAAQIGIDADRRALGGPSGSCATTSPRQGETATLRRVSAVGGIPVKQLFALFPQKPAKKMAYVAGLPKPHGCV